LEHPSHAIN